MAQGKIGFTFTWKIKNLIFDLKRFCICSPTFFVDVLRKTKWYLQLFPNSTDFPGCVSCYLQRENQGPEQLKIDYELSFLDCDGSILHSVIVYNTQIKKSCYGPLKLYMKRNELLIKKDLFSSVDTLTIRCRIWDSEKSFLQPGRCNAETGFDTESITVVGIIKQFSSKEPTPKNLICLKLPVDFISSMNLCVATDGKLEFKVEFVEHKALFLYRFAIFIQDIFGNKLKSGEAELHGEETHTVPLTVLKEHLMLNKRHYLPNDTLTIECEVTFPTGKTTAKIDEPEYGFDTQEITPDPIKMNFTSKEDYAEFSTLMVNLNSLFGEGILYDVKLQTATECFPAHKVVLCARSSVFKTMFCTDMKEKCNNCVNVDDLDADTVRRMLSFMYTDKVDDLDYEGAKNLYFAADKYNMVSLRHRCSSILKQNFLKSNSCEILLLADRHQDNDLKNAVQDYIIINDETVLFSDEWKDLEMNNPRLSTEVLRNMYLKCQRI